MKLKKIAALALAGVMAVSMLAGCANKPGSSEPTEPTPDTTATGYMVEDLTEALKDRNENYEDSTITVSANASLQSALNAVAKIPGMSVSDFEKYMTDADSTLDTEKLADVQNAKTKEAATKDSTFGVAWVTDKAGLNTKTAVQNLANAFMKNVEVQVGQTLENVASVSGKFVDVNAGVSGDPYKYNYEYTVDVAVTSVENPVTNVTVYVMAYNVTRTPVKADV